MHQSFAVKTSEYAFPLVILRQHDEWGLKTVDLVHPPRRFWSDQAHANSVVEEGVDLRRVQRLASPAELLASLPLGENWLSHTRRSVARLHAFHLICGDPQRRMDVREVETLSHQVSLVRHVLEHENLKRVLIADEVGLGKTVEVGLILQELLTQRPGLRVLYLAPARLVSNVRREFDRLNLSFRQWTAIEADARLSDTRIIASIHKAVNGANFDKLVSTPAWDVLIIDECHHLSAWSPDGQDPSEAYRLVREIVARQSEDARVIMMSGTPHQGHGVRFENLLRFLRGANERPSQLAGRVIYRTKDDIHDWDGNPVFPNRQVNEPLMVDLGPLHRQWLKNIHDFYQPPKDAYTAMDSKTRAAGWRCAQAMQWAASSPQAGLGYLVRQAVRAGWQVDNPVLRAGLAALRPYRLGAATEPVGDLFKRISKEVDRQQTDADIGDIEDPVEGSVYEGLSRKGLESLIEEGVAIVKTAGDEKWEFLKEHVLSAANDEKVVLFAQPIETVTALARFLETVTGRRPSLIVGGQSDIERNAEVDAFRRPDGPQFLVSSRAGGEGINLQVARRLIHIDVPWNPMDMEQRVGRIHRFGSRETIIVDTLVVKDSREADAFRIAREKLKLITMTLVEKERFETVFSRVMCLLSQDELQSVMLNDFAAPMNEHDEQMLSAMVQEGFKIWKAFHDRFGQQQKAIQSQPAGLATWDDLARFLEQYAGADRQTGYHRQRFQRELSSAKDLKDDADVLRLADGESYVCGDYGESLVYAPDGTIAPKCGLNITSVADALRKAAFPEGLVGAGYIRWPAGLSLPLDETALPLGVLILLRQTIRMDKKGGWIEQNSSLHCLIGNDGGEMAELNESAKKLLVRGLLTGVIRKSSEDLPSLAQALVRAEEEWIERLRRPTTVELESQLRHSVMPVFAAIVTS